MTDARPAIVRSPFGPEVDGRRLLGEAVGFGRSLRAAHLSIDLGAADRLRAGPDPRRHRRSRAGPGRRRGGLRPPARRPGRLRRRVRSLVAAARLAPPGRVRAHDAADARTTRRPRRRRPAPRRPRPATSAARWRPTSAASRSRPTATDDDDEAPIEGVVISPDAYSQGEVLRHREFDRMTPAELREAERLVDLLVPRLERRRTRRYELHSHGRRLAPRAMFRRNLGTGGQLVSWVWRRPDPRAALARRPVRHLGLDGAPLAAAAAVRPGAVGGVGGPDGVVRVRDAADAGHAAAARPRPRPGARARGRFGQRLGRRDADRRVVPDVQPDTGRGGRSGRRASSSSCPTAGTGATRRSSRPRRPACGATAIAWSGSTRWPARPATSRWPAGCAPPIRTSTTSCRPGPSRQLERLGEILGGVRAGDTRRGSEAASHAALPGSGRPGRRRAAVRRRW